MQSIRGIRGKERAEIPATAPFKVGDQVVVNGNLSRRFPGIFKDCAGRFYVVTWVAAEADRIGWGVVIRERPDKGGLFLNDADITLVRAAGASPELMHAGF